VHDKYTKNELVKNFSIDKKKIYVVRHGLIKLNTCLKKLGKIENMHKKKFKNKLVLSFLGNINKYKGIHKIINLWKNDPSIKNNTDIVLIIAGQLNIKQREIKKIKNDKNVYIKIGFLTNEELLSFIKISDLILLPYEKISQSGLLLTALAEKKPVLVSRINGLIEPFEIANPGWIITKSLNYSLHYIINNKEEIKKIKNDEKMWSTIHHYYSWKKIAEKTQSLYK
jgi:glycosyltransferase involved in cell wall biosynthesis